MSAMKLNRKIEEREHRHLETDCKECGKSMVVKFPRFVTYWRFNCPHCAMQFSIEIIGGRKCLVFENKGRRVIERVSFANGRNRFYRAKCYACGEKTIVPDQELGQVKSCLKCGFDYQLRAEDEVRYETTIIHNGKPAIYREQTQELTGYIINKNNALFLDDDVRGVPANDLLEAIGGLEKEVETLKKSDQSRQAEVLRVQTEKEDLIRKLAFKDHASSGQASQEKAFKARVRQLEAKFEQRLKGMEADKTDLARRLREEREENAKLRRSQSQAKEIAARNKALIDRNQELVSRNKELTDRNKSQADRNRQLEERIERLGKDQESRELNWQRERTEAKSLLERSRQSERELTGSLDLTRERSSELFARNRELAGKLQRMESDRDQLTSELQDERQQSGKLSGAQQKVSELINRNQALSGRIQRLESQQERLESQKERLESQKERLDKRLREEREINGRLVRTQSDFSGISMKNQELVNRLHQLELEKGRLETKLKEQLESFSKLEKRAEAATTLAQHNRLLKERTQQLEGEKHRQSARILELQEQGRALEKRLADSGKELPKERKLKERNKRLESDNKRLEKLFKDQKEAVLRLNKKMDKAAGLVTINGDLRRKVEQLEVKNRDLSGRLEEQTKLIGRIRRLEMELEQLHNEEPVSASPTESPVGGETYHDDWYCNEGEEGCISTRTELGFARRTLGLKGDPTPARIKQALRRRIKMYHPDRVNGLGMDLRELAHKKTMEINQAYAVLIKRYARAR
ncbi:MAG: DnaJ domain-containing protein [Magnetococcales bacterium]|nr:DnaJ domain-containing protein [Magnetococcales bacterium]